MAIVIKPPISGGGAVDSVNGATGVVVLTTDNIDAGSNADRQYFTTSIQSDIDSKADQSSLDTVQGKTLYSNSYYVNEGVNDIQAVVNSIAGGSGSYAIYMSAGSYGGNTLTISDAPSGMDIIAPYHPTGGHICELVSRGLTISGATTTRVRISDLNVEGALLIDGTLGRHYFKNCIFDSTVTITHATANFITFEQCSFAGGISIASSVTATVYFDRCTMGNQLITSLRVGAGSPLLTVLTECSGVNALQVNLTSNVVLVGRTGFNDLSVVQYQNGDSYVYDLNNGLSTSFSGSYTELRNKPTIPSAYTDEQARDAAGTALANGTHTGISFVNNDGGDTIDATVSLAGFSTDNLSQGSTNKYFSDTLARGAFTAGTGISITTGTIASTITQYTDADADARIIAQKGQANGICELDANSLVPTNHLPPLAITDVHVVADATERLALTVQEGDVAIQTDDSSSWIYSGSAWIQFSTGGSVLSVNGQTGTVSLDTDDVNEGATNKYFSDTLARGAFTAGTGISITTGTIASTITQYTDTLAKTASVVNSMSGSQTDQAPSVSSVKAYYTAGTGISLTGGTIASTITQYTDTLAKTASVVNSMSGSQTDQAPSVSSVKSYIAANTGTVSTVNSVSPVAGNVLLTTDNVAEGAINKYASSGTVRALISATDPIVYASATGVISTTLTQYTDELAQDAAASLFTGGTHTGITYAYNDISNKIDSTVSISGSALTWPTVALSIGTTAVSVGNYYYSSTTLQGSAYSLTPPSSGKNGDVIYVHNNAGNTINFGTTAYYFDGVYSGTGQTFSTTENDVFVFTRFGTGNSWFISKQVSQARYTDTLARTAAVVNSMAGTQTTQAPSVSAIKAYYTAGSNITITNGVIASTASGASRPAYSTVSSFPLTISAPTSSVVKERYYLNNSTTAVTVNLPAVASCDGFEIVIKLLGTATATIDASGSETIDGALTFALSLQNSSVTLVATTSGWRVE